MLLWWLILALHRLFIVQQTGGWRWLWRRSNNELDKKVAMLASDQRRKRFLQTMQLASYLAPPSAAMMILGSLISAFKSPSTFLTSIYWALFEVILVDLLVFCLVVLFFTTFPARFSLLLGDTLLGCLFVTCGVHSALVQTNSAYFQLRSSAVVGQILVTLMIGRRRSILLPNILNLAFQCGIVLASDALIEEASFHVGFELVFAVVIFVITELTEKWIISGARAKLRAAEASRSEATAQSLLSMMCDAVVPLRSDLTLREPCPRLCTMLLRGSALSSVSEGQHFSSFIQEADQPRFMDFINGQSEEPGQARSLHVHLVDSVGTPVPVQLFHTCLPDVSETVTHLIGVTEDKDENFFPGQLSRSLFTSPSTASGSGMALTRQDPLGDVPDEVETQSVHSMESTGTNIALWCADQPGDDVTCNVRARLHLEVISESAGSRAFFNFSNDRTETFLSRFRNCEDLLEWLHEHLHSMTMRNVEKYGRVLVINPAAAADYEADLYVTFVRHPPWVYLQFQLKTPKQGPRVITWRQGPRRMPSTESGRANGDGSQPREGFIGDESFSSINSGSTAYRSTSLGHSSSFTIESGATDSDIRKMTL